MLISCRARRALAARQPAIPPERQRRNGVHSMSSGNMNSVERRDAVAATWESWLPTGACYDQPEWDHAALAIDIEHTSNAASGGAPSYSRVHSHVDQTKQQPAAVKMNRDRLRSAGHHSAQHVMRERPPIVERLPAVLAFESDMRTFSESIDILHDVFTQEGDRRCLKREYARILMQGLSTSSLTMKSSGVLGPVPTERVENRLEQPIAMPRHAGLGPMDACDHSAPEV